MVKQLPITVQGAHKSDVRSQFAALCYRVIKGQVQILLVTSRGSGRWIVPKGWPMDSRTPAGCAAQEAWEEAGAKGRVQEACLGIYSYVKEMPDASLVPVVAMVFPMRVKSLAANFPEKGQRQRRWFNQKKAARRVDEPELARIIRDFDPLKPG